MFELLFGRRRSPIQPWKLARLLCDKLEADAELASAIADSLDDERWRAYARALHDAAELLRRAT